MFVEKLPTFIEQAKRNNYNYLSNVTQPLSLTSFTQMKHNISMKYCTGGIKVIKLFGGQIIGLAHYSDLSVI